ncbi:MAG: hypothetical protein HUK24_03000, partial [Sphaerochaetaceae bacterium]|nr:hypothetical protein [Sphaerochaetaceae bacterium]
EDTFKYTFLISGFPHPQNYYDSEGVKSNGTGGGQSQYLDGVSFFMAHRLEWRAFNNKFTFALTEGVMYMSKDNRIDITAVLPSMLYHNNYTRSNTNSILGFEADYTPINGLNIYASVVIDEFNLPGEPKPSDVILVGDPAEPNGIGFLGGVTYVQGTEQGYFSINAEGAYTPPYLYLRDGDLQSGSTPREQKKGEYGLNYVVAIKESADCGGKSWFDEQFLGYKYGGDALVANLNGTYTDVRGFSLSANAFYMVHGTHDKWTVWTRVDNVTTGRFNIPFLSTKHQTENQAVSTEEKNKRDSLSKTLVFGINGSYSFGSGLTAFAQIDSITIQNFKNISSNGTVYDFQLTVGSSWNF